MLDEFDAVTAAPEHHKVLLENEHIRVLETLIRPGEETAMHTHVWGGFLYILSWSDFVRYDQHREVMMDSASMKSRPVPGTAIPAAPLPLHALRNVGEGNIHVILTELKNPTRG